METEKADAKSFYNNYRKLVELRKEAAFASGDFQVVVNKDLHVFAYTRGHGKDQYLVAINFGDKMWDGDIELLSGRGMMVFDSEKDHPGNDTVDVNKIKLEVGQAVILHNGEEEWHNLRK